MSAPATIDDYIAAAPEASRSALKEIRSLIQSTVPDATEAISYAIPTFRLNDTNMIHFAGFDHHIGLYAMPDGHVEFEDELSKYKRGKGSVQFPLDTPMPIDLIRRITLFRAKQLTKGE